MIVWWKCGIVMTQVNAHESEFLLQVEVVVDDNAMTVFLGKKSEQTLTKDGFTVRLAKVQNIKTFLE